MLDILMVTYRSERFEQQAIQSIHKNTDVTAHLTVLDNNAANASITAIWNDYAKQSTADYLCFMNPDVLCAQGWATRLLHAFRLPDVMVATPSSPLALNSSSYPCSRRQALVVDGIYGQDGTVDMARLDTLGTALPPVVVDDPVAHGFCYCVRRDWFMQAGLFDPDFVYYTQETEFSYRTIKAGKRVVCVKNSVVLHFGQGSTGGKRTTELADASNDAVNLLYNKHPEWPVIFGLW